MADEEKVSGSYEHRLNMCSQHTETNKGLKEINNLVHKISEYLYHYTLLSVVVIVNCLTINLNIGKEDVTNSNLLNVPAGFGKTTLVHKILAQSNPRYIISLPDKIYESLLTSEFPLEAYQKKVWVLDDLLTSFRGVSTKQRDQLMGFFNSILAKRRYERQKLPPIEDIKISCMFGIASKNYERYQKKMFEHTFLERVVPVKYDFDLNTAEDICTRKRRPVKGKKPKVVLPFRKKNVDISIPSDLYVPVMECNRKLHGSSGMSMPRGQEYIDNFIRASAFLNGRKEACMCDINLFKQVLPLHNGLISGSLEAKIRSMIIEKSMAGERLTGRYIKDTLGGNESHLSEVLSKIRSDVFHRKISLQRGFDYEYWL
ncbi:hypothetical protein ACFLRC_02370 [Candidatus Altiarchaeota archaeon]